METMSIKEAAVFLKCSPRTVLRRIEEHVYPYIQENGRKLIIKEDLENYLLSKRIPSINEVEEKMKRRRA